MENEIIEKSICKMFVLRGCPGSGKSTWAKQFELDQIGKSSFIKIVSADQYFVRIDGTYFWNKEELPNAHKWCKNKAERWLQETVDWRNNLALANQNYYLIVDNTNIKRRDFKEYVELANTYKFEVEEKIFGEFTEEAIQKYAERNIHNVPIETIRRMCNSLQNSLK